MQRVISVIERNAKGVLAVVSDRVTVECGDDHAGLRRVRDERQAAGATEVLILFADGSVGLHWTKPAEETPAPAPVAASAADAAAVSPPGKQAKKAK